MEVSLCWFSPRASRSRSLKVVVVVVVVVLVVVVVVLETLYKNPKFKSTVQYIGGTFKPKYSRVQIVFLKNLNS